MATEAARSGLVLVILLAAGLAGCAGTDVPQSIGDDEPLRVGGVRLDLSGSDPPIEFEAVHTPERMVQAIQDLPGRDAITVEEIGRSIMDRPIHHVTVGDGPFDLWIVGRHHGNEPTGGEAILLAVRALTDPDPNLPEDAPESFRQFILQRDVLLERLTFHFIPIANPDGSAAYSRGNAAQADLNREYFLFSQPEAQVIRDRYWQVWPDGCIDLHNEGIGSTDWDAFGPDGPLIEEEIFALVHRDVDFALYEVDAAGGRGGDYNEFYNIVNDAPVVGPIVNPTAYHPGTHDMFCSTRGAPGYTPEGAIGGSDGNGEGGPVLAWSTRLHQVTIATSAFHWAGFYDATAPTVVKAEGTTTAGLAQHTVTVTEPADVRLQLVWRSQDAANDWEVLPLEMTVTTEGGSTSAYPADPRGLTWTNTVDLGVMEPGNLTVGVQGPPAVEYELRAYLHPEPVRLVEVERDGADLRVRALADAPGAVELRVTDVFDPPSPGLANFTSPYPAHLAKYEGTVDERVIAIWNVTLAPGAEVVLDGPDDRTRVGPYRFTATAAGLVTMDVEPVRNAPEA